jgi:hypothetical protein
MIKPNTANERLKRAYFSYLRDAHGRDDATVDRVAASLARFEASTKARDFKRFHREQAVAFKAKLAAEFSQNCFGRLPKQVLANFLRFASSLPPLASHMGLPSFLECHLPWVRFSQAWFCASQNSVTALPKNPCHCETRLRYFSLYQSGCSSTRRSWFNSRYASLQSWG